MKRLHVEFLGRLVKVRFAHTMHDTIRLWNILFPGQTHDRTGLRYAELRRLGEGIYAIEA